MFACDVQSTVSWNHPVYMPVFVLFWVSSVNVLFLHYIPAEFSLCACWGIRVFTDWTNELPLHILHWQNRKLLLTACKLSCWYTVLWHAEHRSDSRCCRDSHALCNPPCQNLPSDQAVWQLCGIQATIACKVGTTENKDEMGDVSKGKVTFKQTSAEKLPLNKHLPKYNIVESTLSCSHCGVHSVIFSLPHKSP